jgi:hypothetical protein
VPGKHGLLIALFGGRLAEELISAPVEQADSKHRVFSSHLVGAAWEEL